MKRKNLSRAVLIALVIDVEPMRQVLQAAREKL